MSPFNSPDESNALTIRRIYWGTDPYKNTKEEEKRSDSLKGQKGIPLGCLIGGRGGGTIKISGKRVNKGMKERIVCLNIIYNTMGINNN